MDRINVHGIRAHGRHGANPGERDAPQPFDIDVSCDIDLRVAQSSDDLADTVSYAQMHERIRDIVATRSYALLERLAGELLDAVFLDPRIARATLTIGKPNLLDGATPSITLRRENPRWR